MSSSPRGARPGTSKTQPRSTSKTAAPRLNRAQLQAMEIRNAATVVEEKHGGSGAAIVEVASAPTAPRAGASRLVKKAIARPVLLTRAEEYRYIRADMRRLALTASALFAVMIVLLFIVER